MTFHCCGEGLPVYVVIVAFVSHEAKGGNESETLLHFTMYDTSNRIMLKPQIACSLYFSCTYCRCCISSTVTPASLHIHAMRQGRNVSKSFSYALHYICHSTIKPGRSYMPQIYFDEKDDSVSVACCIIT